MKRSIDVRLLAIAMREVDVIEKRPVDKYMGLATEIAAAYMRAADKGEQAQPVRARRVT